MKKFFERFSWLSLGIVLAFAAPVAAATIYSAGSLLQTGDVKSVHILDGTILNQDISGTAAINATKIAGGGTGGEVVLDGTLSLATSSGLTFATSSNVLTVGGGVVSQASSTVVGNFTITGTSNVNGALNAKGGLVITGSCTGCAGSNILQNYTFGEAVGAAKPVYMASTTVVGTTTPSALSTTIQEPFGKATGATKWARQWTQSGTAAPTWVFFYVAKTGAPSDTLKVSIQSDAAGVPSGTILASGTIPGSSLTTSVAEYWIQVSPTVSLQNGTIYYIVMERTGALDNTNYYDVGSTGQGATDTSSFELISSVWTTPEPNSTFGFQFTTSQAGDVYQASSRQAIYANSFLGFTSASVAANASGAVIIAGEATGFAGLTPGTQYYLNDATGTVGTSAGTVTRKACISTGATTCLITNVW